MTLFLIATVWIIGTLSLSQLILATVRPTSNRDANRARMCAPKHVLLNEPRLVLKGLFSLFFDTVESLFYILKSALSFVAYLFLSPLVSLYVVITLKRADAKYYPTMEK